MYEKILAAVNEHINSEIAARYALTLARSCRAKLYVCFVAAGELSRPAVARAEDAVERLFLEARAAGVQAETITETGDPVREIERIARAEGIDIAFAATRREDMEKRFYAGTVARRLSLGLPCSVALVRAVHLGRIQPRKILVPLKARVDHLRERAHFAAKMAEGAAATLFVFHVTKPITRFFRGEVHLTPAQWEKRLPEDISSFLGALRHYRIEHEGLLTPGIAGRNITIEAAAKRHDLIIMGASERSLLSSILRGNPVESALRETPCDLIILKSRHED